MKRFIKIINKLILLFKKRTKKKKYKRNNNSRVEKLRSQNIEDVLNKKYLDLSRHYNSELPYFDQLNVSKGSIARKFNIPKKAKKKIHKQNNYSFVKWYYNNMSR